MNLVRKSILDGKTPEELTLEETRKLVKEAKDSTKIAYVSLLLAIIVIIIALFK